MVSSRHDDIILEEDEGIYEKGNTFKSFHGQASQSMSQKALLAVFCSVWLQKCVIPSPPHDGISTMTIFPAVQLFHERALGLLPTMVCRI